MRRSQFWVRTPRRSLHHSISARQNQTEQPSAAVLVVVIVAIVLAVFLLALLLARTLRLRYANPRFVPTRYLKRRWERWEPTGLLWSRDKYSSRLQHDSASIGTFHIPGGRSALVSARNSAYEPERAAPVPNSDADVDRRTSVRSVMTLPAYSRSVRETEQVLGREGERDGIDVVLEAPETLDEEEERREEEMESLYRIREQRRVEIREREERRARRADARARGDIAELQRIQEESRQAMAQREMAGSRTMILEHQSRSRERRVSSVSYGDLGVARHDGTRVRANSNESDRPLLDSAASIGGTSIRPHTGRESLNVHLRGRSASSISDRGSDYEFPPYGRAGSDFEVVNLNQTHSRSGSRSFVGNRSRASSNALSVDTVDLGDTSAAPLHDPPSYDETSLGEAPPYTSPVEPHPRSDITPSTRQAPVLPMIDRVPSIHIADASPIEQHPAMQLPSLNEATQTM